MHLPLKIDKPTYTDPHTKANVLLQAYFSRRALSADLHQDQQFVVEHASRLLQAMVDVISSNSWLNPALAAMELSQMVSQAVWDSDPVLKQLPHFTEERISRCKEKGVESVFELMELEDSERRELLQMSNKEMQEVAVACNRYPNIDMNYVVKNEDKLQAGSNVVIEVQLEREIEDDQEVGPVYAPFYPKAKAEGWWLVFGDSKSNQLLSIKRVTLAKKTTTKLEFPAPPAGSHTFKLYFMCDSYSGCDQEYEVNLRINDAMRD